MRSNSAMTPRRDLGARRRIDLHRLLDRARKGKTVSHGGIARDASDDLCRAFDIGAGEEPVDALVDIAEPFLQPRHDLAIDAETEMAGLDDAGMHRPNRNLMQPLAQRREEVVHRGIAPHRRRPRAERRAEAPGTVIEPRAAVRRAERREAIKIAHRALEPDRRRVEAADRGKVRGRHPQRYDARLGCAGDAHREMNLVLVAPQAQQIAAALAEFLSDRDPRRVIDLVSRPRPMPSHRGPLRDQCCEAFAHAVIPAARPRRGTSAPPARATTARPSGQSQHEGTTAHRSP